MGMKPIHLGQTLSALQPTFMSLEQQFGFHVCGEGGEYETLCLDCPLFSKKIVLDTVTCSIWSYTSLCFYTNCSDCLVHCYFLFIPVGRSVWYLQYGLDCCLHCTTNCRTIRLFAVSLSVLLIVWSISHDWLSQITHSLPPPSLSFATSHALPKCNQLVGVFADLLADGDHHARGVWLLSCSLPTVSSNPHSTTISNHSILPNHFAVNDTHTGHIICHFCLSRYIQCGAGTVRQLWCVHRVWSELVCVQSMNSEYTAWELTVHV